MTTTTAPRTVPYANRPSARPWSERVNWRVVGFAAVLAFLVGVPAYQYAETALTGGIRDAGGGYKAVDLKAMVSFPFDQTYGTIDDVDPRYRALHGQDVILRGEIAPTTSAAPTVGDFSLVYSVSDCCYSGPPQIQHFVQCDVPDGDKVPYYSGPVKVRGRLRVDVTRDGEQITGVYHLDVQSIEPA